MCPGRSCAAPVIISQWKMSLSENMETIPEEEDTIVVVVIDDDDNDEVPMHCNNNNNPPMDLICISSDDEDDLESSLDALSSSYKSDWDYVMSDTSDEGDQGQFLDWDNYYGDNGAGGVVNDGIHDYIGTSLMIDPDYALIDC